MKHPYNIIAIIIVALSLAIQCLLLYSPIKNTFKPQMHITQNSLDERIVANIINKKENIKFQKDNYFTLNSSSSDGFFIFKNDDDISIHIGLDAYKTEINNKELSIILDNIKTQQSASREKESEERILKALGE